MTAKKSHAGLNRELQKLLPALGVDMAGVVRISDLKGTELARAARALLPEVRSIIVLGMEVYPEFLEITAPGKTVGQMRLHEIFRSHIDYLSERLDNATYEVARLLRRAGFRTLPLSSRRIPTDPVSLHAVISYPEAAQAAGLGRVGM
ncbi:MAG: hypothetical protein N2506_07220, partial [Dehalococcoidales bacterium]|nr:hypothetical protein [Dehalococcoidales bacterium]